MSVPIMNRDLVVVGVIQISRKGLDSKLAQDFSREDLHDLELVAGLLATAPALLRIQLTSAGTHGTSNSTATHSCRAPLLFRCSRRSVPVISFGSSTPSIPSTVGEISRSDPLGFSVNCLAFSETTINGTGLVVCAVCGPPVAGSIIISALP